MDPDDSIKLPLGDALLQSQREALDDFSSAETDDVHADDPLEVVDVDNHLQ